MNTHSARKSAFYEDTMASAPSAKESISPPQICLHYLEGNCPKDASCTDVHTNFAYLWQVSEDDHLWLDLQRHQTQALEQAYCNAHVVTTALPPLDDIFTLLPYGEWTQLESVLEEEIWYVDFDAMTLSCSVKSLQLRRLSTPSDSAQSSEYSTEWRWYYQCTRGKEEWKHFASDVVDVTGNVLSRSQILEQCFIFKLDKVKYNEKIAVMLESQSFRTVCSCVVDFVTMERTLLWSKVKSTRCERQPLRRRPAYSTLFRKSSANEVSSVFKLPSHWTMDSLDNGYCLVRLQPKSEEYEKVNNELMKSVSSSDFVVKGIYRLENPSLWIQYNLIKTEMCEQLKEKKENIKELQLFRGVKFANLRQTLKWNFDPRCFGNNYRRKLGRGVSFVTTFSCADYFIENGSIHAMILAKVLVGSVTVENHPMLLPPIEPSSGQPYDNTKNPQGTEYVQYRQNSFYPEYVIVYSKHVASVEENVHLVLTQVDVSDLQALEALRRNQNDVTDAIVDLLWPHHEEADSNKKALHSSPVTNLQPNKSASAQH